MTTVDSSQIHKVGYDATNKQLHVVFHSNKAKTYVYKNVPKEVHDNFLNADSAGSYHAANIKGQYEYFTK